MAILRVKDDKGKVYEIPAIKGDKGEKGDAGAGSYIGSYVGDDSVSARYVDLQSPNVKAVLLSADDVDVLPTIIVASSNPVVVDGQSVAWLVDAYNDGDLDLAVQHDANQEGVTYRYIAFVQ